jgi:hypothetical protein
MRGEGGCLLCCSTCRPRGDRRLRDQNSGRLLLGLDTCLEGCCTYSHTIKAFLQLRG